MRPLSLGVALKTALLAGLGAGVVAGVFHLVVTEPVIEQAIALEEQLHGAEGEPIVSRDIQRGGLLVGFLLYGLAWALLFTVVQQIARRWLDGLGPLASLVCLVLLAYWSVALLPFLKYPANPPGVGAPETIEHRQQLYLTFLALSIAAGALAVGLGRVVGRWKGALARWTATLGALVVASVVLLSIVPGVSESAQLPDELLLRFRVVSLAGLTVFWLAFGLLFGWLALRSERRSRTPAPA